MSIHQNHCSKVAYYTYNLTNQIREICTLTFCILLAKILVRIEINWTLAFVNYAGIILRMIGAGKHTSGIIEEISSIFQLH